MFRFPLFPLRIPKLSQTSLLRLSGLLSITLVGLLSLAPLSFVVFGQEPTSPFKMPSSDHFVLKQNADGEIVCQAATIWESRRLEQINPQGLRRINHLDVDLKSSDQQTGETVLPSHLTIVLRATAQLDANPAAKAAFLRAAQTWENQIKSPITIYIDVDFGPSNFGDPWEPGVIGATSPLSTSALYESVRTNFIAGASNAAEGPLYNSLPVSALPTNKGTASSLALTPSIARAIGLLNPTAQPTDPAARIGFNSAFTYDFDPNDGSDGPGGDGIDAGKTDFEAVATHEIGHALGFTSRAGRTEQTAPAIWDIFRFRTGTTLSTFGSAQRIMTADGLQFYFSGPPQKGLSTGGADGGAPGGDGNQSSHWKDDQIGGVYIGIMDPTISAGIRRQITSNDTVALNSFGYNLENNDPPPPPPPPPPVPANNNFANAQIISGCSGTTSGTNIGANKQSGEPSHSPDGDAGGASVWYHWQAPSTGSVTITTSGSNYDTVLGVYTGSSVNGLVEIAKNDDVDLGVILSSKVIFTATAGTVYKIAVDGWGGETGEITLNWTQSNCTPAKTNQTITFASLPNRTFGSAPFNLTATASSGLPVSFQILAGPATISGNTVTITGVGTVTVRASQAGNNNYNAAPNVDRSFIVNKATPVIAWNNPANIIFGTALSGTQLNATATVSGGFIAGTFTYTPAAGTVLDAGSGQTLSVTFTPTDTTKYNNNSKNVQITVIKATPVISWNNPASISYGTALSAAQLNATANVAGTFNYNPAASTVLAVGNKQLSVNFVPADAANYNNASKTVQINVVKASQQITFEPLPSKVFGDPPFSLIATSSSGLPVTFQKISGPATLSGNTVSITGAGTVTVRATQAGNSNYNPAASVDRAFLITGANGNPVLSNLAHIYDGAAKFATVTTNPTGLNVTVTYSQNNVNVASPVNVGVYAVTATINDPNHQGTTTGTLVINKATPVITWNNPADILFGTALSGTQLNAAANVAGSFTYNLPVGTVLNPGTYQLSVAFTPTDASNYKNASKSVQLTVIPTLFLSSGTYSSNESSGRVQITVNRADTSSAASVDYSTTDSAGLNACSLKNGIASARCDYQTAVGTLRFAVGEASKTITIPIIDDAYAEGNEVFTVTLKNSTGVLLGSPVTAQITIVDNSTPAINPIEDPRFFITMQYIDFLGRLPDATGLASWMKTLTGCPNGGFGEFDNPDCDRVHVSSGFFLSDEFRGRGYWAYRFYEVAFDRRPTYAEFVPDMAKVGGPQSPQSEELSKSAYKDEFVQRSEFTTRYNGLSNAAFVNTIEQNAEIALDNAALTAQLNGGKSRAQLLREIVELPTVEDRFYIRAFVAMQYFGYLRRNPDTVGYNNWVTTLTNNPADSRHMIFGFIYSDEYRIRFGPP